MRQKEMIALKRAKFKEGLCYCSECEQFKPKERFSLHRHRLVGYATYCKICVKKHLGHTTVTQRKSHRLNRKNKVTKLLGNKCTKCGYNNTCSLSLYNTLTGKMIECNAATYKEMEECALLCDNCRWELKHGAWVAEFTKIDGLLGLHVK